MQNAKGAILRESEVITRLRLMNSFSAWIMQEYQKGKGFSRQPLPFCNPIPAFYASIFAPLSADCESSAYIVSAFG